MEDSLPLSVIHVNKSLLFINRLHTIFHSIALSFLFYYRLTFFFQNSKTSQTPFLPYFLVLSSEIILSIIWFLDQAFRWNPITRTVFPERLPENNKLPNVDVFICTADPTKEPTLDVMNTVLSAMAMDYPHEKLHVYVSDDGGSSVTLNGMKEAWKFAKWWLPFCTRYRISCRCPEAYFSDSEYESEDFSENDEFVTDKRMIKEKYEGFTESIMRLKGDTIGITGQNHASFIEVIQENNSGDEIEQVKLPLLVYVSRQKKPSRPHNFKAGALNVLYRVSGVISNSPYILVLDCDMFCSEPNSARQAMCFHLDPKLSPSLAFVQFPQKFHNISINDIYDSQYRSAYKVLWQGMDGLQGPLLSGTGFYLKRESLYANFKTKDTDYELQEYVGKSNEFIKSLKKNSIPNLVTVGNALPIEETLLLASCNYENGTKWGKEVGFLYGTVCEDVHTGIMLNCNGWNSVLCDPPKPQFLGSSTTNLNDLLIQGLRWSSGLLENGLVTSYPLINCPLRRMSLLHRFCLANITWFPLYCLPLWCFALVPQICLLSGTPIYPKVSEPFFFVFAFIYVSAHAKFLFEVLSTGGTFQKFIIEQRMWMMRTTTCHLYGFLDCVMKKFGLREASFMPTNKVKDEEQTMLYQSDKYDFRTSNMFLVPMVSLMILNIFCFVSGIYRVLCLGELDKMFIQLFLMGYIIFVNYPIIEGVVIRKDKGRVSTSVFVTSNVLATIITFALYPLLRKEGRMSTAEERIMKLDADRAPKTKKVQRGRIDEIFHETPQGGSQSGTSSPRRNPSPAPTSVGAKHGRGSTPEVVNLDDIASSSSFEIPSCHLQREFFGHNSPSVAPDEADLILGTNVEDREKGLIANLAAMIRVFKTALVLNRGSVSGLELKRLTEERVVLEGSNKKLAEELQETLRQGKDHARAVKNLEETKGELRAAQEEGVRLRDRIAKLEAVVCPGEDETAEEKALVTRANLIAEVRLLKDDSLKALEISFKNAQ